MSKFVLGLMGRKQSGKDTVANRLVTHHGFTRFAFADALKATMTDLNPIVWEDEKGNLIRLQDVVCDAGWDAAKAHPEVRRLLQVHGVAIRTHVDPNAWIRAVELQVQEHDGPAVITDMRFPNEAEWISAGGSNSARVRVSRPGLADDVASLHVSETALDDYPADARIVNDGTLEDLYRRVDLMVHRLL